MRMMRFRPPRAEQPRLTIIKTPVPAEEPQREILQVLRDYLTRTEPKVVRWLHDTWNAEQEAIKYQELRDAILRGDLSLQYLQQWQQDYANLVNTHLSPEWINAMEVAAARITMLQDRGFMFDPGWPEVRRWVDEHGTELAVNLSATQHEALKQLINRSAVMGEFGPDELSRMIRPLVGMVPREALAVQRYYEALRRDGMGHKAAMKQMLNYAARVHRHRAMRIARTELAFAFNQGVEQGVRQAQAQGLIGRVKKRWLTAFDERVCPICRPLDDVTVEQKDTFPGGYTLPPAHPHCRCSVTYEEQEPPVLKPADKPPTEKPKPEPKERPKPVEQPKPKPERKPKQEAWQKGPQPGDFKSDADAQSWASKKYKHILWELEGLDPDVLNKSIKMFDQLAQEYPEVVKRLKYVGTRKSKGPFSGYQWKKGQYAHAATNGQYIGINPVYYGDYGKFLASCNRGAMGGWHPRGSTGVESVLTHEFGHQVHNWLLAQTDKAFLPVVATDGFGLVNATVDRWIKDAPVNDLCGYAKTNGREKFAEAFAALYHGDKKDRANKTVKSLDALLDMVKDPTKWHDSYEARTERGKYEKQVTEAREKIFYSVGLK